jgi:AcrR family transcriptional regulator
MVETRRERHRRELVDEIRDEARRQLEAGGAASVSWRAIARCVGMRPA